MSSSDRIRSRTENGRFLRRGLAAVVLLASGVAMSNAVPASAVTPAQRVDLRVLLLDDGSPWVDAVESQMMVEGVPFTRVEVASPARPVIDDAFLSSGDEALFQSVVASSYTIDGLTEAERGSLRAFEAKFAVREVDGYNWANPAVGLNYAAIVGEITGTTAMVTAAGKADGFGYLNGPIPYSAGSYSYVAEPLDPASQVPGATFTTLVGASLPSGGTGSLIGVYSNAGVEQLIITSAFSFSLPQYKYVAHGIITWMTRGVHFGYNRNNFTFHVDDAFVADSLWDPSVNCTPGEDCTVGTERSARMTPADVDYAVQWMLANNYQLTLAFNGFYADAASDALTQKLQQNESSFRWLNHGFEHIYQGCIQDFAVTPWRCVTDAAGNIEWLSQQAVVDEIQHNIAVGQALGLSFDATEYLSGEHSGLFLLPQQPVDNPNFVDALTQLDINFIGSDASRDNVARQVGSATTIPRHPTALYYNTSTRADAVDEYNWLYTTRANGGSGYCEDNPTVATCIAPLNPATGFTSYIVPTDANFDLSFILSNDPRPFYAHTTNLTDDRLAYYLLDAILATYRTIFTTDAPLINMTLAQASTQLARQMQWAANTDVSGHVQNGQITISNPSDVTVPFTAPTGTTINGTSLESYGGESSAWLTLGSTTGTLPGIAQINVGGSTTFVVGTANTITISASGSPTPSLSLAGELPTALTFDAPAAGAATISGIAAAGSGGSYPVTVTADNGLTMQAQPLTINVVQLAEFTSPASATAVAESPFSFTITTMGGYPTPTISRSGGLPSGVTFRAGPDGTATLSGTPEPGTGPRNYSLTFSATNAAGTVRQPFVLSVAAPTSIGMTVSGSTSFRVGRTQTITITTLSVPPATITLGGELPTGVAFDSTPGSATIAGTPAAGTGGSYPMTVTATSGELVRSQSLTIIVTEAPQFTSATSATAVSGTAFSFSITTTGSPPATLSRSGKLPSGITFTVLGDGAARLSGTPTLSAGGRTYSLTLTAKNSAGTTRQTFTLTVERQPTISGSTTPTTTAGDGSSGAPPAGRRR